MSDADRSLFVFLGVTAVALVMTLALAKVSERPHPVIDPGPDATTSDAS